LGRGLRENISHYLATEVGPERDALLFTYPSSRSSLVDAAVYGPTVWKPTLAAAGLRPYQANHLRNFGARPFRANGADAEELRELMGHANFATTQKYLTTPRDLLSGRAERAYQTR
jgi:site-specific recombinase XerD